MNSHTLNPMTNTFSKSATGNVAPRSQASPREADSSLTTKNPTATSSPAVQEGLNAFFPKQYALFGLVNKNKLPDYLAHPVKNINNVINFSLLIITVFSAAVLAVTALTSRKKSEFSKTLGGLGLGFLLMLGDALFDLQYRKDLNKDTLKGIQVLGENATLEDWQNYKKSHPKVNKT